MSAKSSQGYRRNFHGVLRDRVANRVTARPTNARSTTGRPPTDWQFFLAYYHGDDQLKENFPNFGARQKEIARRWREVAAPYAPQSAGAKRAQANEVNRLRGMQMLETQTASVPATTISGAQTAVAAATDGGPSAGAASAMLSGPSARPQVQETPAGTQSGPANVPQSIRALQTLDVRFASRPFSSHVGDGQVDPVSDEQRAMVRDDIEDLTMDAYDATIVADNAGLGRNWVGGWKLSGGHNRSSIWVHVDEAGNVDDRLVVKRSFFTASEWVDGRTWVGGVMDPNRRPMEFVVQERLNTLTECDNFVRVRHCHVDFTHMLHTMYLAYCPYGDMGSLVRATIRGKWEGKDDPDTGTWHLGPVEHISEPMLWNILECLTEAALTMQQGHLAEAKDDWLQIVHRDIKPDNIFFDTPDPSRYTCFPKPVLGDFGSAMQSRPDDPSNPIAYQQFLEVGRRGYVPPEIFPFADKSTGRLADKYKILAAANIWGIGVSVMTAMNAHFFGGRNPGEYDGGEVQDRDFRPSLEWHATKHYSQSLQDLVKRCVEYRADERIQLGDLHAEILRNVGEHADPDLSQGARHGPSDSFQLRNLKPDPYRLGLSMEELPGNE